MHIRLARSVLLARATLDFLLRPAAFMGGRRAPHAKVMAVGPGSGVQQGGEVATSPLVMSLWPVGLPAAVPVLLAKVPSSAQL